MNRVRKIVFVFILTFLYTQLVFAQAGEGNSQTIWGRILGVFKKPVAQEKASPKSTIASEKPKTSDRKPGIARPKVEDLSPDEIRDRIKSMVESSPEALDYIPELKASFNEDETVNAMSYKKDGISVNMEELDKETLIKVYSRVNRERTRLNAERIQRQLESIRAAQNINRIYAPPPVPTPPPSAPPTPPRVQKPPQVPSIPSRR